MIERNERILATSNQSLKSAAVFSLIMGVAFTLFSAWQFSYSSGFIPIFLGVLGFGFMVSGALRLRRSSMFPRSSTEEKQG